MVRTRFAPMILAPLIVLGCSRDRGQGQKATELAPAPTLHELVPHEVYPHGYRRGIITGEGLDPKRTVTVFFGETRAKRAAVVTKQQINVEIPPGPKGTEVSVRVEVEGHQPVTLAEKCRYLDPATSPPPPSASGEHDHEAP